VDHPTTVFPAPHTPQKRRLTLPGRATTLPQALQPLSSPLFNRHVTGNNGDENGCNDRQNDHSGDDWHPNDHRVELPPRIRSHARTTSLVRENVSSTRRNEPASPRHLDKGLEVPPISSSTPHPVRFPLSGGVLLTLTIVCCVYRLRIHGIFTLYDCGRHVFNS